MATDRNAQPENKDKTFGVKYVGGSDVRELSKKDLKTIGLGDLDVPDLRWDRENGFTVNEGLTAEAVEKIVASDSDFKSV